MKLYIYGRVREKNIDRKRERETKRERKQKKNDGHRYILQYINI